MNIHKLYRKPNDELLHINKHSNHPASTLCHLPKLISKRVLETPSNEEMFNIFLYMKKALKDSDLNEKLVYDKEKPPTMSRMKRKNANRKLFGLTRLTQITKKLMLENFPKTI